MSPRRRTSLAVGLPLAALLSAALLILAPGVVAAEAGVPAPPPAGAPAPAPPVALARSWTGSPIDHGDGTWTVRYSLTVTNSGDVPVRYSLRDELRFGEGTGVLGAEATSPDPRSVALVAGWDGQDQTRLVDERPLGAGRSHRVHLEVIALVSPVLDAAAADCEQGPEEDLATGFSTAAVVAVGSQEIRDEACRPVAAAPEESQAATTEPSSTTAAAPEDLPAAAVDTTASPSPGRTRTVAVGAALVIGWGLLAAGLTLLRRGRGRPTS